jgi:hypothetical protein
MIPGRKNKLQSDLIREVKEKYYFLHETVEMFGGGGNRTRVLKRAAQASTGIFFRFISG